MNTIKHFLLFATSIVIMFACGSKNQEANEQESNLVEITNQQFATDSMQLGEIETRTFESIVKCNGSIVPLPNGIAKANAPVSGVIKNINCHNGQSVDKNQVLLEIAGNEIIDTQKEFAEASANYKLLKSEYERIKSLFTEQVTSEKEFLTAESEFKASMARYNGLKMKIDAIGFSISKIENGEFYTSYSIKAPIGGYITKLKTNIGSYIDNQTDLLEIINPNMFQIKLSVFATDINLLEKGQTVRYKSVSTNNVYFATVSSVGVHLDNDTKSAECYASITDNKITNPIANEFVEAEVVTSTNNAKALPNDAIIKTETGFTILALEKQENEIYYFRKVDINIGKQHNGYTEILTNISNNKILTKGLYNIVID